MSNIISLKFIEIYEKYKNLSQQSILNFLSQILYNIFNLILFFYIANYFDPSSLSAFLMVSAVCRIISFFFDGGFNQLILSEFSDKYFQNSLIKIFILRNILSICILIILIFTFYLLNFFSDFEFKVFLIISIIYLNNENLNYFYSIFMSMNKNIYIVWIRLTTLFLSFVIFFLNLSFENILVYILFCNFFAIFLSYKLFQNKIRNKFIKVKSLSGKNILNLFIFYSSFLILSKGIGELNSNIDMIFMNKFTDNDYTNLYGLIMKINQISLLPHMLLGSMILPYFAKIKNSENFIRNLFELRSMHIQSIYIFTILLSFIVFIFQSSFYNFNLNLFDFTLSLVLNLIICFLISSHFHLQQFIISQRKYKELFFAALLSFIVNFTSNFILIPNYNVYGAQISLILSHLIVYIVYARIFKKATKLNIFYEDLLKYAFNLISIFIVLISIFWLKLNSLLVFFILISIWIFGICYIFVKNPLKR